MNPVLLQKQLRDNVSDLEQFSKDLQNWGEEMKRKEVSLKTNGVDSKPKVQKLEKKSPKPPKSPKIAKKIGSTDYGKWDKFDADAECSRLEGDLEEDSELSDEIDENARDEAMLEKEKGNKFVKNKQWDDAIKCYSKAIECYSYDPVFYANRALCYLKKNMFFEAEKDCTLSIKLDKTYVKALQRRAAANEALKNFEAAEYDLVQVIKFEPNNKESKAALDNVRKKMGKATKPVEQRPVSKFTASRNKIQPSTSKPSGSNNFEEISTNVPIITRVAERAEIREHIPQNRQTSIIDNEKSSIWPKDDDIVLVKPIKKPPHMRSKKPLHRIKIVATENSDVKHEKVKLVAKVSDPVKNSVIENIAKISTQEEMEQKIIMEEILEQARKQVTFEDNSETHRENEDSEMKKPSSAFKVKRDQMKAALDNIASEMAWPKPNEDSQTFKTDDLKILEKKLEQENNFNGANQNNGKNIANNDNASQDTKEIKDVVTPKNSVQFYHMWRDSKTPEEKVNMLRQIDSSEIPNIFKEALDVNIFSAILNILSTHFIDYKYPVYDILINFTEVKRFSAFTMFMDSADKKRLWKLVSYMRDAELKTKEEVDLLIQKYEL